MKIELENGNIVEPIVGSNSIKSDRYYEQMRRLNGVNCLTCLCLSCSHNDGRDCSMTQNPDFHTCYCCDVSISACDEYKKENI